MPQERLPMRKIREVLRLHHEAGLSNRQVARAVGLGVASVSRYLQEAARAGLGWPLPEELDDGALELRLSGAPSPPATLRPLPSFEEMFRELKKPGVTLRLLWQEYVEAEGDSAYGYTQFCEHYRSWGGRFSATMRQEHRAGEKTFIDFSGHGPWLQNPETGERTEAQMFVAVLGASSYTYAEALATQRLSDWIAAHERMGEFFHGHTQVWVPDQLRSAVSKPCRYEPELNRTYEEFARHHGAVVIPARPRHARDKAKVEVGVLLAQRWLLAPLRRQTFFSLAEVNAALRERLRILNSRRMRVLGKSRQELYEEFDRPLLRPLPDRRYEIAEWKRVIPNIDYHVEIDHNFYSVAFPLRGRHLEARVTASTVELFLRSKRLESYPRLHGRGRFTTRPEHMPSSHRAHSEWRPSQFLDWGAKIGPAAGRVVAAILAARPHPEQGYRSCLALRRLSERYGRDRMERACARAERLGEPTYRTIKNILTNKLEQLPFDEEPATPAASIVHDNIRGAEYYAD